jgi:hypothetical protein
MRTEGDDTSAGSPVREGRADLSVIARVTEDDDADHE